MVNLNKFSNNIKIGRAFNEDKCMALYKGLQSIIGNSVLKKEFVSFIEKIQNQDIRILLLAKIMTNIDKAEKDSLETFMKTILKIQAPY